MNLTDSQRRAVEHNGRNLLQPTHVLYRSALLAHAFQEPGWERVRELQYPHIRSIPTHLLKQGSLPAKT